MARQRDHSIQRLTCQRSACCRPAPRSEIPIIIINKNNFELRPRIPQVASSDGEVRCLAQFTSAQFSLCFGPDSGAGGRLFLTPMRSLIFTLDPGPQHIPWEVNSMGSPGPRMPESHLNSKLRVWPIPAQKQGVGGLARQTKRPLGLQDLLPGLHGPMTIPEESFPRGHKTTPNPQTHFSIRLQHGFGPQWSGSE